MPSNGRLTSAELSPMLQAGQVRAGYQLANNAAAAWNAMAVHIHARTGQWIQCNGTDSCYRPYDRQVYWRNYWCSRGHCENAAIPGTSNHGWGLACDVPPWVRSLIDAYGAPFGWAKKWSDAPWEPWHIKYRPGVWDGKDPTPTRRTLRRGMHGPDVKAMQKRLRGWLPGHDTYTAGRKQIVADGKFGNNTWRAVKLFQYVAGLTVDGRVGPKTAHALRRSDPLTEKERYHVCKLYALRYGGMNAAQTKAASKQKDWCRDRRRFIKDLANRSKHGWDRQQRRDRHRALTDAINRRRRLP